MLTHNYCISSTDKETGETGCFIYHIDKPFVAISPVFDRVVDLYMWMSNNGWRCDHELPHPWGCHQLREAA